MKITISRIVLVDLTKRIKTASTFLEWMWYKVNLILLIMHIDIDTIRIVIVPIPVKSSTGRRKEEKKKENKPLVQAILQPPHPEYDWYLQDIVLIGCSQGSRGIQKQ